MKKIGGAIKKGAGKLAVAVSGVKIKKITTKKKPSQVVKKATTVKKTKPVTKPKAKTQAELKTAFKKTKPVYSKPVTATKKPVTIANKYLKSKTVVAGATSGGAAGVLAGAVSSVAEPETKGLAWYWWGAIVIVFGIILLLIRPKKKRKR